MQIILISDFDEIVTAYTLRRFIQEANKQYGSQYFTIDKIEQAINWYSDENDVGIDLMYVETSVEDDV